MSLLVCPQEGNYLRNELAEVHKTIGRAGFLVNMMLARGRLNLTEAQEAVFKLGEATEKLKELISSSSSKR